jgi:hypothetical protein
MAFQVDGNLSLEKQELQLQAIETFFVEVIDYQAGSNIRNDVTTKNVTTPVSSLLRLRVINNAADAADVASKAKAIVFDRVNFVTGKRERVIGFRV